MGNKKAGRSGALRVIPGPAQPTPRIIIWPFKVRAKKRPPYILIKKLFSGDECRQIIALSGIADAEHEGGSYDGRVTRSFRQAYVNPFEHEWIPKKLEEAVIRANSHYGYNISGLSGLFNVLEYRVGDHTGRHHDMDPTKLTVTVALNDDYDEGELIIEGARAIPRLRTGDAIVMPGWASHEVKRVTKGKRTVLIAWVLGPDFS